MSRADLLGTIRQRYRTVPQLREYVPLCHRKPPQPASPEEAPVKKGGLLNFFRPYFQSFASRFQRDMTSLFTRQAEARERKFSTVISRDVQKQAAGWREAASKTERQQRDYAKTVEKRIDTVRADLDKQLTALHRRADAFQRRQAEEDREQERIPWEHLPISRRETGNLLDRKLSESRIALQAEAADNSRRNLQDALRRIREEEEYERMRKQGRDRD